MGYLFLLINKLFNIAKMVAMKSCGSIAKGFFNSIRINMLRTAICVVVSVVICLLSGFVPCPPEYYVFLIGAGIATGIQLISWVLAVQEATVCLVEVIGMIGSMVLPLCLAPVLYHGETVSLSGWIGAALLLFAVFLFSPAKKDADKAKKLTPKTVLYLAGSSLGGGGAVIFQKLYATSGGDTAFFNLVSFAVTLVFLCLVSLAISLAGQKPKDEALSGRFDRRVALLIVCAAVCLYGSQFFFTRASGLLPSEILYPLSPAITMLTSFLCDTLLYHEKVTIKNLSGIAVVTAAVFLVCF